MSNETSDAKAPIERALDVFFYAPLGFVMNLEEVVPELVAKGRQQVTMARMFGQFAVQQGGAEATKLAGKVQEQAAGIVSMLAPAGSPASPASPAPTPATPTGPPPAQSGPDAASLAITDYDSLSASQVVPRLDGLSVEELEAVRSYEAAHRNRKTILSKVAQLTR